MSSERETSETSEGAHWALCEALFPHTRDCIARLGYMMSLHKFARLPTTPVAVAHQVNSQQSEPIVVKAQFVMHETICQRRNRYK